MTLRSTGIESDDCWLGSSLTVLCSRALNNRDPSLKCEQWSERMQLYLGAEELSRKCDLVCAFQKFREYQLEHFVVLSGLVRDRWNMHPSLSITIFSLFSHHFTNAINNQIYGAVIIHGIWDDSFVGWTNDDNLGPTRRVLEGFRWAIFRGCAHRLWNSPGVALFSTTWSL